MNKRSLSLLTLLAILMTVYVNIFALTPTKKTTHKHKTANATAATENTQEANTSPPVIAQQQEQQRKVTSYPLGLALYRPTYVLPFYYTQSPYEAVYQGNTPNNQTVKSTEFKTQISFQLPVISKLFNSNTLALNFAYTQLSYWQVYASSQYFRETNYEPELFVSKVLRDDQELDFGVDHQSNGRGGDLERSWNRAYVNYAISGPHWLVAVRPWVPIFKAESIDLHNPDIMDYLGYGWVIGAYKFHNQTVSLMLRNLVESGFSRGAEELNWSFPVHGRLNFFVQVFSGYGQSLIEYNHYTNAIGVGFTLNNWI